MSELGLFQQTTADWERAEAAEFYRRLLSDPSHTRYTDPALRTVHDVASRALNRTPPARRTRPDLR